MSIIANIQARIEAIEGNTALDNEEHFRERADLLDAMELHVFDTLAALAAAQPHDSHICNLYARTLVLQNTLVGQNEQFCERLRTHIAAGNYDCNVLLHTFMRNTSPHPNDDLVYDGLDALINTVVRAEAPPEEPAALASEMVFYQPTPARLIVELVQRAQLSCADVFYDIGSGLGQVAIVVSLLSGARAIGIEVDASSCAYARRCATALNLQTVEFRNEDARTAMFSDGTLFYLYTPFSGTMLQTVLDQLRDEAEQRPIRICTYGPCTAPVAQQPWLIAHDPIRSSTLTFFHSTR